MHLASCLFPLASCLRNLFTTQIQIREFLFPGRGLSVMANAPRVTYGQGIARHHGSHRSLLPTPYSLLPRCAFRRRIKFATGRTAPYSLCYCDPDHTNRSGKSLRWVS
ncbi:hypothetical protein [Moorena producens]|uniref:hypothetical protein n=1 Tax=Moorena producens TaxID=1155739 RepID=UPI0011EA63F9|nr:hypothetical protein [Moorena producens]